MLRDASSLESERGGWEFIKDSATNPRRDRRSTQPCVYTNTRVRTLAGQLCLDRAPLSVTFFAEVLGSCSHRERTK